MAFMPFVTAGDPDIDTTIDILCTLSDANVDLIEVGFPYSDPIADGPVIQASYTRALDAKTHVRDLFTGVGRFTQLSDSHHPPLLAMVSYAIMFRHGLDSFVDEAAAAGFSGFIIPDLPGDEAADCFELIRSKGLDLVQLVAPTTPQERVKQILRCCSGFVYCIAVAGITGERDNIASSLLDQLDWLKTQTDLPLAVGFGISKPEHAGPLQNRADGVIVGSAIVRHLQQLADGEVTKTEAIAAIGSLATDMVSATGTATKS